MDQEGLESLKKRIKLLHVIDYVIEVTKRSRDAPDELRQQLVDMNQMSSTQSVDIDHFQQVAKDRKELEVRCKETKKYLLYQPTPVSVCYGPDATPWPGIWDRSFWPWTCVDNARYPPVPVDLWVYLIRTSGLTAKDCLSMSKVCREWFYVFRHAKIWDIFTSTAGTISLTRELCGYPSVYHVWKMIEYASQHGDCKSILPLFVVNFQANKVTFEPGTKNVRVTCDNGDFEYIFHRENGNYWNLIIERKGYVFFVNRQGVIYQPPQIYAGMTPTQSVTLDSICAFCRQLLHSADDNTDLDFREYRPKLDKYFYEKAREWCPVGRDGVASGIYHGDFYADQNEWERFFKDEWLLLKQETDALLKRLKRDTE